MNIRLHVFLATLLFSVVSNAQSIGDCSSFQVATVSGGVPNFSADLKQAIKDSQPNDEILVGDGQFPRIVIKDKSNLIVKSSCNSVVQSFVVKRSDNIRIEGFEITDTSDMKSGIYLGAGRNSNSFISIVNNKIHGETDRSGIRVKNGNSNILIEGNEIFGNENAIIVNRGDADNPITIKDNHIYNNNKNGILIKGNPVVNIIGNRIENNGLGGDPNNGYGIKKRNRRTTDRVTLTDNVIVNNNGREVPGEKSQDLSVYTRIIDPGDTGNTTTTGVEGPNVDPIDTANPLISADISNGQQFKQNPVSVNITVVDQTLDETSYFLNGTLVGSSSEATFSVDFSFVEGINTVRIESKDRLNNSSSLEITNLLFDSIVPALTLLNINDNIKLNTTNYQLEGAVEDSNLTNVKVFVNDVSVLDSASGTISLPITFNNGVNTVKVEAEDVVGNKFERLIEGITVDTLPPVIVSSIQSDALLTETPVSIDIEVNDPNGVGFSDILLNGLAFGNFSESPYTVELPLSQGNNTITIVGRDAFLNETILNIENVFVDSLGPQLSFSYQDGQDVSVDASGLVEFSIQSNEALADFSVRTVQTGEFIDLLGFGNDFSFVYQVDENSNSETFTFEARDIYGNVTELDLHLNFTRDVSRPVITLSKAGDIYTNQENFDFDVSVSDAGDTTTRVILNGSEIQGSTEKNFSVSASLAIGVNTIRVTSVDSAGNIAEPVVLSNINFDNTLFSLSLASPVEGSELENSIAQIVGSSDRELASITVNGQGLALSSNLKEFSGAFDFGEQFGELVLNLQATDRYGNIQNLSRPVFIQEILRKNLAYITDSKEGKIHVYNSDDLSLVREIQLDPVGQDPGAPGPLKGRFANISLSVDKKKAFVIQASNEQVAIIDLESDSTVFNNRINLTREPTGSDPNITGLIPNKPIQVSDNGLFTFIVNAYTPEILFDGETVPEPEVLGGLVIYNSQAGAFTQVDIPGIEPQSIQVDSSGSTVYMSTKKDSILVFDASTNSVLETINISVSGLKSNDLLLSNDESAIYVSSTESNLLYKIDLSTKQLIQSINIGGQQKSLVRIGSGTKVYALTLKNGSSFLSTIDESSNTVSQELDLGFVANKMKASLDGLKMWITSEASNQIKVVDLATNIITNTLNVNSPLDVAFGYIDEKSTANIPPLASFNFSSNQLIAPATFSFDGSLSKDLDGSIASYSWNIDGNIQSGVTTSYRFDNPGTYNIALTVTDDGSISRTKTVPVVVADRNTPPTAIFYTKAITDFGEYKIEFDASRSFKTGGEIAEYRWDFGDGKAGSGRNVIHKYESAGTYLVSLVVEDSFGLTSSATRSVSPSDVTPLNLSIISPRPGLLTNQGNIIIEGSLDETSEMIKIAGARVLQNPDKSFSGEVSFYEQGVNIFRIEALDNAGNNQIINLPVIYDSVSPILTNPTPSGNIVYQKTGDVQVSVKGNEPLQSLKVNSETMVVSNNAQRDFSSIVSFISSGQKNLQFSAVDLAGNTGTTSSQFDLVIDSVAPVLSFNPALPTLTNQSQILINAEASDDTPTSITISINGQVISNNSNTTLIKGENKIIATAVDSAGNESSLEEVVFYDGDAPSIQLSLDDGHLTNQSSISIRSSIYDVRSTVSGLYLNGALIQSSADSVFDTVVNLNEGNNTVVLTSQDEVGNIAAAQTINVTLDTIAPVISNIRPVSGSVVGLKTLDIFLSAESNEPLQSLTVNGSPLGVNIANILFQDQIKIFGDGPQTLTFSAIDKAGNENTFTHSIDTALDSDSPVIQLSGLADNQELSVSEVTLSLNVQDSSAVNTKLYLNDKFVFDSNDNNFNYVLELNEGINNLKVVATDSVENVSEVLVSNVKSDTKGPVLNIASPIDGQEFEDSSILVSFSSNEPMYQVLIFGNMYDLEGATSFNQNIETGQYGATVINIQVADKAGNISSTATPIFIQIPAGGGGVLASADASNNCVLINEQVFCWGRNNDAQVGDGTTDERFSPVPSVGLESGVSFVDLDSSYACAIKSGELFCWGRGGNQRIINFGPSGVTPQLTPKKYFSNVLSDVTHYSGAGGTACLVDAGAAKCWGNNFGGRLGIPTNINANIDEPTVVPGAEIGISRIEDGENHIVALTDSGVVKTWGFNYNGALGDGTTDDRFTPSDVVGITETVVQISSYRSTTCAVTDGGKLYCWGSNSAGQIGNGTLVNQLLPYVVFNSGIKQVSVGDQYVCAVTTSNAAKCWGQNSRGQLGNGTINSNNPTPQDVLTLDSGVDKISAGKSMACASMQDTSVRCWGGPSSNNSQPSYLGDGTANRSSIPVAVINLPTGVGSSNVIANISASPIRGKAPLDVNLMGEGSHSVNGTINSYSWELSGSVVSTDANFSQNFPDPGQFPIKLTVTDTNGESAEKSLIIIVEDDLEPIPLFSHNLNISDGIVSVSFNASESNDPDGSIANYGWSFGDGNTGSGATIVHQYTSEGTYDVQLTVTSDNGQQKSITKSVVVKDVVPPILTIASPVSGSQSEREFVLSGFSNEKLSSLSFNGSSVALGTDQKSFSQSFNMNIDGQVTLELKAVDLSQNSSRKQIILTFDSTGPILSSIEPVDGSVVYSQNGSVDFRAISNEPLSSLTVNGSSSFLVSSTEATNTVSISGDEYTVLNIKAFDLVGNKSVQNIRVRHEIDNSLPVLSAIPSQTGHTQDSNYSIDISATDNSLDKVEVIRDGIVVREESISNFTYSGILSSGVNSYSVKATDKAGNETIVNLTEITLDNQAPTIFVSSPSEGETLSDYKYTVVGSVSEPMSSVTIGGKQVIIESDLSFEFETVATSTGNFNLEILGSDLAGNQVQYQLGLDFDLILLPNLISINPVGNGGSVLVQGHEGSTKPNTNITIKHGFFASKSTISDNLGKFSVEMSPFGSAKIFAKNGLQESEADLHYIIQTRLAGIVKNIDGQSLPGVKVMLAGSNKSDITDLAGSFNIEQPETGKQTLIIDASVLDTDEIDYSNVEVGVNISLNKSNILEETIYLAPLIKDGREVLLTSTGGVTISNPQVPNVSVNVQNGVKATFPNGKNDGVVSVYKTTSDKVIIPVPQFALPDEVIHLEPSGLVFDKPVELILPNDNNLEPGVEFAIMSMNVKTGTWEIDGVASVDPSGSFIKTKNGQGITHFSPKYAAPIGPVVRRYSSVGQRGIDTLEGGLEKSVSLPSFKSLSSDIAPSLSYNSAWAKPSAVVTNYFSIPDQRVELSYGNSTFGAAGLSIENINRQYCNSEEDNQTCFDDYLEYWEGREHLKTLNAVKKTSWYEPKSIKTSFFVSGLGIEDFTDGYERDEDKIDFNEGTWSGNPNQTLISFGVDLKKQDGKYFDTGIYPAISHYEIELEHITLTSRAVSQFPFDRFPGSTYTEPPVINITNEVSSKAIEEVFPVDLTNTVYVQNQVKSSAGRGWRVDGVKKIANPGANRLMIEEANGELSLYFADNNIETLANFSVDNQFNINLYKGVGFGKWPTVALSTTLISGDENLGNTSLVKKDLSDPSSQLISVRGYTPRNGQLQTAQVCPVGQRKYSPSEVFVKIPFSFHIPRSVEGLALLEDGRVFGTDAGHHSLFLQSNSPTQTLIQDTKPLPQQGEYSFNNYETLQSLCRTNFHSFCKPLESAASGESCPNFPQVIDTGKILPEVMYSYTSHGATSDWVNGVPQNPGDMPIPTANGLNSPKGVLGGPDGNIYVADYGNNRVVSYNLSDGTMHVIAGNGVASDIGENILAVNASLFHPVGLAFDSSGNLYVTTERGYIRRITTNGFIDFYAGKPLDSSGSRLEDQTPKDELALGSPTGIVINNEKNLMFVADTQLDRVIQIDMLSGNANLFAGSDTSCGLPELGDGDSAIAACLKDPTWLGLDDSNNLLIADAGNKRIRRVNFSKNINAIASFSSAKRDNSKIIKNTDESYKREYRSGVVENYSREGLLESVEDKVGRVTTFLYNSDDNIESITDSKGQSIDYVYSGEKITSINTPRGNTILSYSGDLLDEITFPDGYSKRFVYDSEGLLIEEYNERNKKSTYEYNIYNRLAKITLPDNSVVSFNDHLSGTFIDPNSSTTNLPNMDDGEIVGGISSETGEKVKFDKDLNGYIYTQTDALGNETKILRDIYGNPKKITRPDGTEVTMKYNENTLDLEQVVNSSTGRIQEFGYDDYGNVIYQADGAIVTRSEYYANGLLKKLTNSNGSISMFEYTALGLLSKRTVQISNSDSIVSSFVYDSVGNLKEQFDSTNAFSSYVRDAAGNAIESTVRSASGEFETTLVTYDEFNRITSVTNPRGEKTEVGYSPTGKMISVLDPNNLSRTYSYNDVDKLETFTNTLGHTTSFIYDADGRLSEKTTPNNDVFKYYYNDINLLVRKEMPDDVYEYAYNTSNQVVQVKNKNAIIDYDLDTDNRNEATTIVGRGALSDYPTTTIEYGFNQNDRITSYTDNHGTSVLHDINTIDGKLERIQSTEGYSFTYSYDLMGRKTSLNMPGMVASYDYGNSLNVEGIDYSSGSVVKAFFNYTRNDAGMVTSVSSDRENTSYSYNENNHLTGVSRSYNEVRGPASLSDYNTEVFSYDSMGNRSNDSFGASTYDITKQLLQEDSFYQYSYDNTGNLLSKTSKSSGKHTKYEYSSENQLLKVSLYNSPIATSPEKVSEYFYDALGRRLKKDVKDFNDLSNKKKTFVRQYAYNGTEMYLEFDNNSELLARYVSSIERTDDTLAVEVTNKGVEYGISQASGTYLLLKDQLGSITHIADLSGNIVQKMDYSVYGIRTRVSDSSDNDITDNPVINIPFGFANREFDVETGLYFNRARYYDPSTGRFMQMDKDPGSVQDPSSIINKFIYAGNNPLNFVDPSGKAFFSIVAGIIVAAVKAAVIAGTISAIAAAVNGANIVQVGYAFEAGFKAGAIASLVGSTVGLTMPYLNEFLNIKGFWGNALTAAVDSVSQAYALEGLNSQYSGAKGALENFGNRFGSIFSTFQSSWVRNIASGVGYISSASDSYHTYKSRVEEIWLYPGKFLFENWDYAVSLDILPKSPKIPKISVPNVVREGLEAGGASF